jgi:hypothetical protein
MDKAVDLPLRSCKAYCASCGMRWSATRTSFSLYNCVRVGVLVIHESVVCQSLVTISIIRTILRLAAQEAISAHMTRQQLLLPFVHIAAAVTHVRVQRKHAYESTKAACT